MKFLRSSTAAILCFAVMALVAQPAAAQYPPGDFDPSEAVGTPVTPTTQPGFGVSDPGGPSGSSGSSGGFSAPVGPEFSSSFEMAAWWLAIALLVVGLFFLARRRRRDEQDA